MRFATSRRERNSAAARRDRRFEQSGESHGKVRYRPVLHIETRYTSGVERIAQHSLVARQAPAPRSSNNREGLAIDRTVRIGEEIHWLAGNAPQVSLTICQLQRSRAGVVWERQMVHRMRADCYTGKGRELPDLIGHHGAKPDRSATAPSSQNLDDSIPLVEGCVDEHVMKLPVSRTTVLGGPRGKAGR